MWCEELLDMRGGERVVKLEGLRHSMVATVTHGYDFIAPLEGLRECSFRVNIPLVYAYAPNKGGGPRGHPEGNFRSLDFLRAFLVLWIKFRGLKKLRIHNDMLQSQ